MGVVRGKAQHMWRPSWCRWHQCCRKGMIFFRILIFHYLSYHSDPHPDPYVLNMAMSESHRFYVYIIGLQWDFQAILRFIVENACNQEEFDHFYAKTAWTIKQNFVHNRLPFPLCAQLTYVFVVFASGKRANMQSQRRGLGGFVIMLCNMY